MFVHLDEPGQRPCAESSFQEGKEAAFEPSESSAADFTCTPVVGGGMHTGLISGCEIAMRVLLPGVNTPVHGRRHDQEQAVETLGCHAFRYFRIPAAANPGKRHARLLRPDRRAEEYPREDSGLRPPCRTRTYWVLSVRNGRARSLPGALPEAIWMYAIDLACKAPYCAVISTVRNCPETASRGANPVAA